MAEEELRPLPAPGPRPGRLLLGAFFWSYAGFMMPSGVFVDRIGPRVAYALAVSGWSVITAACSVARSVSGLFGLRFLLGIGQAPAYPSNAKVVSEWFPRRERAFATSIFDSGSRVGNMLSFPIVAGIISALGWRWSFAITGALGLIWTVAGCGGTAPPASIPGCPPPSWPTSRATGRAPPSKPRTPAPPRAGAICSATGPCGE
jgi:MFS family permease